MTIPNRLTVARIFMSPVFYILFVLSQSFPEGYWLLTAWVVYLVAEFTDILDGWVARKWDMVSDLGKVLDPFADVVSRITYFAIFLQMGIFPLWAFLPILYRELGITFLRMVLLKKGKVMAANWAGKAKAWFYFGSSLGALSYSTFIENLGTSAPDVLLGLQILFGITAGISVLSIIPYLKTALEVESS